MKREMLHTPLLAIIVAGLGFTALPLRAEENPVSETAQTVADDVVDAAHSNPLRRRWAQMSDEERAQFVERRRMQLADQGPSVRERLQNLSPRQKAHLRKRLANANQPPHRPQRPHHPQARRRAQAAGQ